MDCSTSGFPVHHQLPELVQTHIHWVGDAIQPSHPLLSPSPAFSLAQHQGLFQWVSSSHQVAKVLEFQLQHWSFQWIQDWFPLGLTGWFSFSPRDKSLHQHHSSKASILWRSAFFIVQLYIDRGSGCSRLASHSLWRKDVQSIRFKSYLN